MKILISESQYNILTEQERTIFQKLGDKLNKTFFNKDIPQNKKKPIKKTYNSFEVVAATLIGEAGGESNPKLSMTAVLNVLNNRSKLKHTKMYVQALSDKQFSMWNGKNKNNTDIYNIIQEKKKHRLWNLAMSLVKSNPKDITHGATHYYVFSGPSKVTPSWIDTLKSTIYPTIKNPNATTKVKDPKTKVFKLIKNLNFFYRVGKHLFGKTNF